MWLRSEEEEDAAAAADDDDDSDDDDDNEEEEKEVLEEEDDDDNDDDYDTDKEDKEDLNWWFDMLKSKWLYRLKSNRGRARTQSVVWWATVSSWAKWRKNSRLVTELKCIDYEVWMFCGKLLHMNVMHSTSAAQFYFHIETNQEKVKKKVKANKNKDPPLPCTIFIQGIRFCELWGNAWCNG